MPKSSSHYTTNTRIVLRARTGFVFGEILIDSSLFHGLLRVPDMYSGTPAPASEHLIIREAGK